MKGLGDAISCAERHTNGESFVVLLGDSITKSPKPCTKQLIETFNRYQKPTISIREVSSNRVCNYGIADGDEIDSNIFRISQLIEKPTVKQAPSNLAIMGRYVLTKDFFDKIDWTKPGFNGEILLIDALSNWMSFTALNSRARFSILKIGSSG